MQDFESTSCVLTAHYMQEHMEHTVYQWSMYIPALTLKEFSSLYFPSELISTTLIVYVFGSRAPGGMVSVPDTTNSLSWVTLSRHCFSWMGYGSITP